MAELIGRLRGVAPNAPAATQGTSASRSGPGGTAALALALALMLSIQAAVALVARGEHRGAARARPRARHLRPVRVLVPGAPVAEAARAHTGYVGNDPLSLAPFIATGAIATLEVFRTADSARDPERPAARSRRLRHRAAARARGRARGRRVYAFIAYLAGLSGAVLGLNEPRGVPGSTLRKRPSLRHAADRGLRDPAAGDHASHLGLHLARVDRLRQCRGPEAGGRARVRVPERARARWRRCWVSRCCATSPSAGRGPSSLVGLTLVVLALSMTFVRSAWVALLVAGVAHVVASRGRSARPVFGAVAVMVAASIALSPVSYTAQDVVDRFKSITNREDTSTTERRRRSARSPRRRSGPRWATAWGRPARRRAWAPRRADLRHPDNGYLSLLYQSGPIGLPAGAGGLGYITRAAWTGARDPAPGPGDAAAAVRAARVHAASCSTRAIRSTGATA